MAWGGGAALLPVLTHSTLLASGRLAHRRARISQLGDAALLPTAQTTGRQARALPTVLAESLLHAVKANPTELSSQKPSSTCGGPSATILQSETSSPLTCF